MVLSQRRKVFVAVTIVTLISIVAFALVAPAPAAEKLTPDIQFGGQMAVLHRFAENPAAGVVRAVAPENLTDMSEAPDGSGRFFVTNRAGKVYLIQDGTLQSELFLDLTHDRTGEISDQNEGLTSIEFHPGFGDPSDPGFGKFYTIFAERQPIATPDFVATPGLKLWHHDVINEWTMNDIHDGVFSGTTRELMRVGQLTGFHNTDDLKFGPDGMLYVSIGDGFRNALAQETNNIFGKVLRIDPFGNNSENGNYGIPPDNPFVNDPASAKEVYAIGFRNPYRLSFDRETGDLYVSDVGELNIEEVNLVEAGGNYGWPLKEGSFLYDEANRETIRVDEPDPDTGLTLADAEGITDPIFEYDHTEGFSVIGGYVYRGDDIPWLVGKYVMGEWSLNRVLVGDLDTHEIFEMQFDLDQDDLFRNPYSIDEGLDGELYILSRSDHILKIASAVGPTRLEAGDADQDLDFDQLDLVKVQIAAKYLTGQPATWGEGDWNGAPGGVRGDPPSGDGQFNQFDIIAAQIAGLYLTGPYATIKRGGKLEDDQTTIFYDATTGEVAVDAPAGVELTSINIDSAAAIFTGDPAQNQDGSFDNDSDSNIFKATFGSSFGSLSFGNVAQAGLDEDFLLADLTVIGSLRGGGALGDVDLVYIPVPEPATVVLLAFGILVVAARRGGRKAFQSSPCGQFADDRV